jgi:hypothetical protein
MKLSALLVAKTFTLTLLHAWNAIRLVSAAKIKTFAYLVKTRMPVNHSKAVNVKKKHITT